MQLIQLRATHSATSQIGLTVLWVVTASDMTKYEPYSLPSVLGAPEGALNLGIFILISIRMSSFVKFIAIIKIQRRLS